VTSIWTPGARGCGKEETTAQAGITQGYRLRKVLPGGARRCAAARSVGAGHRRIEKRVSEAFAKQDPAVLTAAEKRASRHLVAGSGATAERSPAPGSFAEHRRGLVSVMIRHEGSRRDAARGWRNFALAADERVIGAGRSARPGSSPLRRHVRATPERDGESNSDASKAPRKTSDRGWP
jgi:hypothetical protein